MAMHFGGLLLLAVLFLFRTKIPTLVRGLALVGILFVIGVGSFPSMGTVGSGLIFFLTAVILTTVLFGTRFGVAAVVICTAVVLLSWLAFRGGIFAPTVDFNAYVVSTSGWLAKTAVLAMFGSFAAITVGLMRNSLASALDEANSELARRQEAERELERHRDHLEELVQERTRELEAAQEELIRSERYAALGHAIASIAHEIRNPLGTVRNCIYNISNSTGIPDEGPTRHALDLAERNIDRANAIISDILDYVRDPEVQKNKVRIKSLIEAAVADIGSPPGIDLAVEPGPDIEIQAVETQLRSALINVLKNAVQAIQSIDGLAGRISVRSSVSEDMLELSVEDNGVGLTVEQAEKAFEPLYSTKNFGVGLGLPIVERTMKSHGGAVELTNNPGEGCTAVLRLPIR